MKNNRVIPLCMAVAGLSLPLSTSPVSSAGLKEVSKDVIAVQIRKQGFECKNPLSAERDKRDSAPDDAAWILKCEGVTYRVELVPKMAAKVERLSDEPLGTEGAPQKP